MLTSTFRTATSFPLPSTSSLFKQVRDIPMAFHKVAYIIIDDEQLRTTVASLTEADGVRAEVFTSVGEYLSQKRFGVARCLLISKGLSDDPQFGLQRLRSAVRTPPIILLSDDGDLPSCVRAIREGAHDYLTLPLVPSQLLETMHIAFKEDEAAFALHNDQENLLNCWRSLTPREAEVMRYVVDGFLNKQTAGELRITENTVQVHRGRVMRKMRANSSAALVCMSLKLASWGEDALLKVQNGMPSQSNDAQ